MNKYVRKISKKLYLWAVLLLALVFPLWGVMQIYQNHAVVRDEIAVESTKYLLQFSIIVVLGTAISILFKSLDQYRRQENALSEFRTDFLNELGHIYRDVKRLRRTLRAAGLTTRYNQANLDSIIDEEQATIYSEEMSALDERQLELERLKIEAGNFPEAFLGGRVKDELECMEKYLRDITNEYEEYAPQLAKNIKLSSLSALVEFTGPTKSSANSRPKRFKPEFSRSYRRVLAAIRVELLPIERSKLD